MMLRYIWAWLQALFGYVKVWPPEALVRIHYAPAMEEDPVTVSLGPIEPLFQQLRFAIASLKGNSRRLRLKKVKAQIQILGQELEWLCIDLKGRSEAPEDAITRCWMRQVRDLCYDTADYLDELLHFIHYTPGAHRRLFGGDRLLGPKTFRISRGLNWLSLPKVKKVKKLKRAPLIAKLSALVARVEDADERRKRFMLSPPKSIKHDYAPADGASRIMPPTPFQLHIEELNKLLGLDGNDMDKNLKVVTIFGSAGVDKTAVARTLYHQHGGRFQHRAFIRVTRDPDMRRLLTDMLSQIKAPPAHEFSDAQGLIASVIKHLQGKRYLIVIDDVWTTSSWDIIIRALPDGDYCRIITTTQVEDVALACCSYQLKHIYEITPLNEDQSGKSEGGCTTYPSSEGMKEALNLAYNNLPPRLKTCLLYLNMYPEGYTIWKDELVKQWLAEGFIGLVQGQDIEDTAGYYFDALVSSGLVQSVDTNHNGEVLSCTLHHLVLDLIRQKSMEENFVTIVNYFQTILGLPHKVRRLSVQLGGAKGANHIPENMRISQVRSLLFSGYFKHVPSILDYGLLQVLILHIWSDEHVIFDLTTIGELYRLRYLKIESNMTVKLPGKIRRLQDLGTLQVDARLCDVPSDIVHLEKLLHLHLPSDCILPHGIGRMTSLHSLGYFDLGSNSEDNVRGLNELQNLQDLQLTCSTGEPAESLEKNMQLLLGSVLQKLSMLRSITLAPGSGSCNGNTRPDYCAVSSMSISCDDFGSLSRSPSHHLQTLELSRHCCIFSRVPKWLGELAQLCILKIAVRELSKEGIDILKGLRPLTALSLHVATTSAEMIVFGKGGFSVLTYFKFTCTVPWLKFEAGAMPNLHTLKLCFNATTGHEQGGTAPIIIEHLSSGLKEISAKICCARGVAARSALSKAISNDPSNPEVQLMGSIYDGGKGRGLVTREESGEDENNEAHSRIHMLPESSRLLVPDVSPPSGDQAAPISQEKGGSVRLQLFALPWTVNSAPDDSSRQHRTAADESSWPPALPLMVRFWLGVLDFVFFLSQRSDGTVRRWFFSLGDWQTPARPRPDARGVRSADVIVDASRKLWLRVYYTVADAAGRSTPLPVVVYFHGGGFALLSAASTTVDDMCRRFCRELGAVVVSVNYRLAPEHRYPAAYDDCVDVLHYLSSTGLPGGISVPVDLSRCFLAGNGAGGNIAHHVAQRWTNSPHSNSPVRLAGIILLQPYFGGEERTEAELRLEGVAPMLNMRHTDWSWKAFLPEGADRNHPAAHVTGQAGPDPELAEAFPPAMVAVGGMDPLQDWQWRYVYMLQRKGKAVRVKNFPDAIHAFYCFPELPDSARLLEEIKAFIESNASIRHSAA